jgi:hypothetical protein
MLNKQFLIKKKVKVGLKCKKQKTQGTKIEQLKLQGQESNNCKT